MSIELSDDGTLDTVLRCSDCGEELRYTFDGAHHETDDPTQHAACEAGTCGCYGAFVAWAIEDAEGTHECPNDPNAEPTEPGEDDITTMTHSEVPHVAALRTLGACNEGVEYAAQHPSLQAAWSVCPRGDWLLWYVARVMDPLDSASGRRLVRAACLYARKALPIWEARYPQDARPRTAIETAERWARGDGDVTIDVRKAACTAYAAAAAAYAAAYATAAAAAAAAAAAYATAAADAAAAAAPNTAADAATDAADAAAADAYATAAAAAAAADAAAADAAAAAAPNIARTRMLAHCADLVRTIYPTPPCGSFPTTGTHTLRRSKPSEE